MNFDVNEIINRCKAKAHKTNYKCSVCKDTGYIIIEQPTYQPVIKECSCRNKERLKQEWLESGFNITCNDLTLNKFQDDRNNSISFLGEPGTGKTHICIGISLELLKKGFKPIYFPYRDVIDTMIDLRVNDKTKYETKLNKYQKCNILFLDDLFKGGYTEAEIKLIFKIINYRYINKLPIIVSSEHISSKLLEIDRAIGSRIIEMSKNRILDIAGEEYNQRLC